MRLVILVALVTGALWAAPAYAQSGTATVTAQSAFVRSGPGVNNPSIGSLEEGDVVTLIGRAEGTDASGWTWAQISQGWVAAELLDFGSTDFNSLPVTGTAGGGSSASGGSAAVPSGDGISGTTKSAANFRTGPGTSNSIITLLSSGTSLVATGRNSTSDWLAVNASGQSGWIYAPLVNLSGDIASLPVADGQGGGTTATTLSPVSGGPGLTGFGYGAHVDSFAYPNLMANAGMTWSKRQVRFRMGMSGSDTAWMINQAHSNGFKILLGVVGYSNEMGNAGYFEDYARFVGEVAALGPDAIEVWNEQNIDREWPNGQIDPSRYTQLLAQAYNAIKTANSNVAVISGAPSPTGAEGAFGSAAVWNDDRYVQGMAAAGAAQYMDCIGAHYNEGIVSPTQTSGDPRDSYYTRYFWGMVNTYSAAFGGAKPICFTELGYLTPEGYGPLPGSFSWAGSTSVAQQAQWVAEAIQQARSSGKVRLVIIWNMDFTQYEGDPMAGYALVRPGGSCPACDALASIR
jgi:uncharacterized protein YraI